MKQKHKIGFKKEKIGRIEAVLYALAGISGLLNTGLWFIVDNNDNFPNEHPIILGIGLGSLALILISGLVLSCIREYKISPYLFWQTVKKITLIFISSIIFTILLFLFFIYKLRS